MGIKCHKCHLDNYPLEVSIIHLKGGKMNRRLALFLFAIFLALSTYLNSQDRPLEVVYQKKRIALVIGNAAYKSAPLKNPNNDAKDMASMLKRFGFDVTLKINARKKTMEMAIRDFGNKIKRGGIGLFYYAGHGMQIKGSNYLIPIGTNIQAEDEIEYDAVDMGRVLSKMESAGNDMNIIILDACRDNPFARSFRSSSRGLVRMDAPKGTLIVYSTSPGKTAADGTGRNGIFTEHFLNIIKETNLEITHLLKEVRRRVSDETNGIQIPWESSSLIGNFYFPSQPKPAKPVEAGGIKLPPKLPKTSSEYKDSIEKAAKERERKKSKWENWQTRMKSDFTEVEKIDKSTAYTNQDKEMVWRLFLDNYKADNPYSTEDEQLRQRATQRIKELTEPEVKVQARVSLRSYAKNLGRNSVGAMFKRHNFFSKELGWNKGFANPTGDFKNNFESRVIKGDKVVLDHATGLMWHQSGLDKCMIYKKAKEWVNELNRRGYAGFSDWRLPTLEEGASLLENRHMNGDLYIDPLFSAKQRWIWTSDMVSSGAFKHVWIVSFRRGNVYNYWADSKSSDSSYVRPVRSGR